MRIKNITTMTLDWINQDEYQDAPKEAEEIQTVQLELFDPSTSLAMKIQKIVNPDIQ